ncbi:DUF493 family protein [Coralloluteibacterium stylophorae]|uniref:DUF493 family protein n=1 Tax=Coralloluteibacterium stylophorae TaxID=1776034 RepID=A0A8J8AWA1_9GAMM|nr:DUF493 family protein [Coralloluteibacterium stylophorae]MBS7458242.1 DUF493 family protein [Coralloluteibacterium stylophorae]
MSIHSDNPEHGFQFPGTFEVSAMGSSEAELHSEVTGAIEALGLQVLHETLRIKPSSKGTYVSVTVSFVARSRADYDAVHEALRAHPEIKWTL